MESARKKKEKNQTGESNRCECGAAFKPLEALGVTIMIPTCDCREKEIAREDKERREREHRDEFLRRQGELDRITNNEFLRGEDGKVTLPDLTRRDDNKKQIDLIEKYIKKIPELVRDGRSMGFIGDPGTGKTALIICIHKEIVKAGFTSALVNVSMFFPRLDHLIREERSTWGVIDLLSRADALFLDDVFRHEYTKAKREVLYRLLEYRYPLKLPVFFGSNKYGKDLEETREILIDMIGGGEVGAAIIDRLLCIGESARAKEKNQLPRVTILSLTGESWR